MDLRDELSDEMFKSEWSEVLTRLVKEFYENRKGERDLGSDYVGENGSTFVVNILKEKIK